MKQNTSFLNQPFAGKLHGIFAVFEDSASLMGALIFNSLYPVTRPIFSGTMFLVGAAMLLVPALSLPFIRMDGSEKRREKDKYGTENPAYEG